MDCLVRSEEGNAAASSSSVTEESDSEQICLTNLPDNVIIHILSYLGHDFLRYFAPDVNVLFRQLALSRTLWTRAYLCCDDYDLWDSSVVDKFLNDLKLTPYLYSLRISLLSNEYDFKILPALAETHCKIYQLILKIREYSPEILMFLQRHGEIRELTLYDMSFNLKDGCCRGVAAVVASIAPRLNFLDFCQSHIFEVPQLFPPTATAEGPHLPADHSPRFPAGAEPPCPDEDEEEEGALDLREADERRHRRGPRGLRKLKFKPAEDTDPDDSNVTQNLESILHLYRHSLVSVRLDWPKTEVFQALAQCRNLTSMAVTLTGSSCAGFAAAMDAMERPATSVRLGLRLPLSAAQLALALRALAARGPPLDLLELEVLPVADGVVAPAAETFVFPGFVAMSKLLLQRGLRKLVLVHMAPVGRAEMLELAGMAPGSLRHLEMEYVRCSRRGAYGDCRDRADEELQAALPGLQVEVLCHFFDDGYDTGFRNVHGCFCERSSGWGRSRRGRGRGRGRGGF